MVPKLPAWSLRKDIATFLQLANLLTALTDSRKGVLKCILDDGLTFIFAISSPVKNKRSLPVGVATPLGVPGFCVSV